MSRPPLASPLLPTLALRLLAGRGSRLLAATAWAALAATALGTAALAVAMALMTGYREDLQAKLLGGNAAVLVFSRPADPGLEPADPAPALREIPGVARVDRVAFLQGVLAGPAGEAEVTVRGAGPGAGTLAGPRTPAGEGGIAHVRLGRDLAQSLGAAPGDTLRWTVLGLAGGRPRFSFRTLVVEDIFATGFSEFDQAWAVMAEAALAAIPGAGSPSWEIAVDDPARAPVVAAAVRDALGPDYLVADWTELNRELFAALRLQKLALFLLIGLVLVVATFNVASTLMVLVRERRRDLGVLAALGLEPARLERTALLYGLFLGAAGTGAGLTLAAVIVWVVDRFELLSFGPEIAAIYFLSSVPLRLSLRRRRDHRSLRAGGDPPLLLAAGPARSAPGARGRGPVRIATPPKGEGGRFRGPPGLDRAAPRGRGGWWDEDGRNHSVPPTGARTQARMRPSEPPAGGNGVSPLPYSSLSTYESELEFSPKQDSCRGVDTFALDRCWSASNGR